MSLPAQRQTAQSAADVALPVVTVFILALLAVDVLGGRLQPWLISLASHVTKSGGT